MNKSPGTISERAKRYCTRYAVSARTAADVRRLGSGPHAVLTAATLWKHFAAATYTGNGLAIIAATIRL